MDNANKHNDVGRIINKPSKGFLTLHKNPDADSVGSNLALYEVLTNLGHTCDIYSIHQIPQSMMFLSNVNVIQQEHNAPIDAAQYNVYWALDMSEAKRRTALDIQNLDSVKTVMIDHHSTNEGWGDVQLCDKDAVSTTTVLFDLFKQLNIKITNSIAVALIVGILGDSSFMTNTATTKRVLNDISELMDYDINLHDIIRKMLAMTPSDVDFVAKSLPQIQFHNDKNLALLPIPYEVWSEYGSALDKSNYLTQYIKRVEGVDIGIIIIEHEPQKIRIRIRSNNPHLDISPIAQSLGGGGHAQAAGAQIEGITLSEAVEKVLASV